MGFDSLKASRKISLTLILFVTQLIIIITFGAGWSTGYNSSALFGTSPYSTLIPYSNSAPWWFSLTSITMYINLVFAFLYLLWTALQIVIPDSIPFELTFIVLVDTIWSAIYTILLLIAYCFFVGGFNTTRGYLGYCFWLAVVASILSFVSLIVSGYSWLKN